MDLKGFAVYQKLKSNSTLLEYIVKDELIPASVVEENMRELLEPLQHSESEALINDYRDYLRHTVKTNFSKREDNIFDVNGHIDDQVIESIELLHGVEREEVVRDVVTAVMGDLNSDRHVEIDNVLLSAEADDFLRMATKPLFSSEKQQPSMQLNDDSDESIQLDDDIEDMLDDILSLSENDYADGDTLDETVDAPTAAPEDTIEDEIVDIDPADLEDIESFEAPLRDLHVTSNYDEDVIADDIVMDDDSIDDIVMDDDSIDDIVMDDDSIDDILDEDDRIDVDEDVYDNVVNMPYDEPLLDDDVYVDTVDNSDVQANAFKQAYDFLITQLHEKGLVDRLPGLHVPQV